MKADKYLDEKNQSQKIIKEYTLATKKGCIIAQVRHIDIDLEKAKEKKTED